MFLTIHTVNLKKRTPNKRHNINDRSDGIIDPVTKQISFLCKTSVVAYNNSVCINKLYTPSIYD